MNFVPKINRRSFFIGTAAVGGGHGARPRLRVGPNVVRAADGSPEVGVWVVIRPDNTTVIRIARSEMGQGTLTGLAQLVAEELECDWSKVTTEYPTPGESVARKRAWGAFSTGGSRGIRESQKYVREGGAARRMMLVQAAANEWKVPASECTASNSTVTHASARPSPTASSPKPPPSWSCRRTSSSRIRRTGRSPASRCSGSTPRQGHRQDGIRHRRQAAGNAQRLDQAVPGVRRQGEELTTPPRSRRCRA
jgi:CO/xanthine dehydrogenase Mo-binding subunit